MRLILRTFPDEVNSSQCILFLDGKYTIVHYNSYNGVSIEDGLSLGDYDDLVKYTNDWLLRIL